MVRMWLSSSEQSQLIAIAKQSIQQGLLSGGAIKLNLDDYPEALQAKRATFVTLELDGELRGCVGMLEATRPLVQDVAENAYAAAFRDRRFRPLSTDEFKQIQLHISVLSEPETINFDSEADLIRQLRPFIDGLILVEGGRRATFLPTVWNSLPEPEDFLEHLKRKAGWSSHYWSENLKAFRYTTDLIE
jgi:uncharacterized protein